MYDFYKIAFDQKGLFFMWTSGRALTAGLVFLVMVLPGCFRMQGNYSSDEFDLNKISEEPLSPEEARAMFRDLGESWLYGRGVGETALTVGTIVLFPPFALVVAGNSVLSMTGHEPVTAWRFMPQEGAAVRGVYDSVVSAPGRASARIAGEDFQDDEKVQKRLEPYFDRYRKRMTIEEYFSLEQLNAI